MTVRSKVKKKKKQKEKERKSKERKGIERKKGKEENNEVSDPNENYFEYLNIYLN